MIKKILLTAALTSILLLSGCIPDSFKEQANQQSLAREHGRGLCLLGEVASKVTFNSAGNQVEIYYQLTASSTSSH